MWFHYLLYYFHSPTLGTILCPSFKAADQRCTYKQGKLFSGANYLSTLALTQILESTLYLEVQQLKVNSLSNNRSVWVTENIFISVSPIPDTHKQPVLIKDIKAVNVQLMCSTCCMKISSKGPIPVTWF